MFFSHRNIRTQFLSKIEISKILNITPPFKRRDSVSKANEIVWIDNYIMCPATSGVIKLYVLGYCMSRSSHVPAGIDFYPFRSRSQYYESNSG